MKSGRKPDEVAVTLDISRSLVYATKKAYDEKGIEGIKAGKRGRRVGEKRTLTPEDRKSVV